ncbi:hypothetical protein X471_00812 [Bartonella bacilliformis str. Heidi Mejia]|uniref:hypothetical protein n=1 Tax=Bartonella bacilliformis TaxID=774 RepID=UPI00044782F1|nr:hypothetical protein [Bartonella bacilliformis]EYS91214.1 hypothetical protein X471_00812 [Bartonella bacilliformis str. Heidi Mejia]KEG20358.1 hypothetical protein H707_00143 [Bartonella bacilliformis Hosp800-02]KEG25125.1 hypothetical protein H706_00144 [Bartonella bacilliformis CAR600-02]
MLFFCFWIDATRPYRMQEREQSAERMREEGRNERKGGARVQKRGAECEREERVREAGRMRKGEQNARKGAKWMWGGRKMMEEEQNIGGKSERGRGQSAKKKVE